MKLAELLKKMGGSIVQIGTNKGSRWIDIGPADEVMVEKFRGREVVDNYTLINGGYAIIVEGDEFGPYLDRSDKYPDNKPINFCETGIDNLRFAVIESAAKDYVNHKNAHPDSHIVRDAERFFTDDNIFGFWSNVDGKGLLDNLNRMMRS